MNRKSAFWAALWLVLVVLTGYFAFSRTPWMGYGPWHGGAWADRWDNEDANAYPADRSRSWQGMPHGWMGGWRPDGEWNAGRGGMMGPYAMPGMGFGMPGAYGMMPWSLSGLTPEQSRQIEQLQAGQFERNRALMRQMWETQARLGELYAAGTRDWEAIRGAAQKLFELQRRQQESAIELQQKIESLLTDAQRQELAQSQRGCGWMDWQ